MVHFEIGCRDRAKTERFFADLFGWHIQQNGPASTIDTASRQGIPGHITSLRHEPHHYTMFYVEVDDVQTSETGTVIDYARPRAARHDRHDSECEATVQ